MKKKAKELLFHLRETRTLHEGKIVMLITVLTGFMIMVTASAEHGHAPPGIDELRDYEFHSELFLERAIKGGPSFDAALVSYASFGLTVYAMVATPKTPPAQDKYPVIIANHGFHPDPPRYGITTAGVDHRPGDYYRAVPELYTRHGFMVIMPDYRGHNISQGREYTHGFLAANYYTQDVLALLACIDDLDQADTDNIFMWGHSLGAEVTLRALLGSVVVRGASLWSMVGGTVWEQAYYYSRQAERLQGPDSNTLANEHMDTLREEITALNGDYDWQSTEPLLHLDYLHTPLIIHHAVEDAGASYNWSARLAGELYRKSKPYRFYSYAGADHLFTGKYRQEAVAKDVEFFRSLTARQDSRLRD